MKSLIIALVVAFIVFEFIEHMAVPLIWFIRDRNKKSEYGVTGMIGKVVEIKKWDQNQGQVLVDGELWRAFCNVPLTAGDKAVIMDITGLMLKLTPYEKQ